MKIGLLHWIDLIELKLKIGNGALAKAHCRGSEKFPRNESMKIIDDVIYGQILTRNLLVS